MSETGRDRALLLRAARGVIMGDNYEEIPIEPGEATDLDLHVRNCLRRHTAMTRMIGAMARSHLKSEIITWVYRAIIIPVIGWIAWEMWKLPDRLLAIRAMLVE